MGTVVFTSRTLVPIVASSAAALAAVMTLASPIRAQSPPVSFAGSTLDRPRAAQLARQAGVELIDLHVCPGRAASCVQLAVRTARGDVQLVRLSDRPCGKRNGSCFAGYTVASQLGSQPAGSGTKGRPTTTAAKISAKPGKDGAPPDPQHEAQADANNEIIEALADGQYDGEYDRFWTDLESIHTWETPTWREPDRGDRLSVNGRYGLQDPSALVSGRYETSSGGSQCRSWNRFTSATATITGIGNWLNNLAGDGCDSEVALFSTNGGAVLERPERRWSEDRDFLDYTPPATIKVPTSVWIIYAASGYTAEEQRIKDEFAFANQALADSRCGIELQPTYHDRITALADPWQELGCASIESTLKNVGFHPNRMNVYLVRTLIADDRAGVACTKESENVIILDPGRNQSSLAHEYGHWFDLWHTSTKRMPQVDVRNIMSDEQKDQRNRLTGGQCYRANFSRDSYINKQGLRTGPTKSCGHEQDDDEDCPGLKTEFDGQ